MNLANKLSNFFIFGMISLCVFSAYSCYKTGEDIRRIKTDLKKTDKMLTAIRKAIDKQNTSPESFITAFRMNIEPRDGEGIREECYNEAENVGIPYTVREYKGIIGIFDDGDELVRSIDKKVSSLSAPDRQSLLLGIRAESESELEKIIDSFG